MYQHCLLVFSFIELEKSMIVEKKENGLLLAISEREALIFLACARESFAAIHEQEYRLRIGYSIEDVSVAAMALKLSLENVGICE